MILLKVLLILSLFLIFYQDHKERKVYWFLLPTSTLLFGILFYFKTTKELFFISVLTNLLFIGVLLLVIFLYAKYKLRSKLFSVFGLGDLLLFLGLAFTFSSISFLIIFITALVFSLLMHLFINKKGSTVPLAGYMSLFFGLIYIAHWLGLTNNIYAI